MTVAETTPIEEGQPDASEKRVVPLELFFDLVFVFAITQVTVLMSQHPTWEGLGQGLLVLTAVWWCWGAYAWLTNYIAADEGLERLLMFVVMGFRVFGGQFHARNAEFVASAAAFWHFMVAAGVVIWWCLWFLAGGPTS